MNFRLAWDTEGMGIQVTKDGPYLVSGDIPLSEQKIGVDDEGSCHGWEQGATAVGGRLPAVGATFAGTTSGTVDRPAPEERHRAVER